MTVGRAGPDYSALTVKGIIGSYYKSLEDELAGSWASKVGVFVDSNQETESYKWLGHAPQLREWLNARMIKGTPVRAHTITNATYEATLGVDVEDFHFDKTGQLKIRVAELAKRGAQHWEKLVSALIEANGICYDSQNFFDTDHSMGGDNSTAYSNALTNSDIAALNVATAAAATAEEWKEIIIRLAQYFYTYKDNANEPYNGGARAFALMVSAAQWGNALAAVRSDRLGSATTNGGNTNAMQTQDFKVEVICNPRLTSDTVAYMFRTDSAMKPFILQEAVPPEMSFLGEGSDEHFKFNRYLFGVKAVRAAGLGEWAHAIKATLS